MTAARQELTPVWQMRVFGAVALAGALVLLIVLYNEAGSDLVPTMVSGRVGLVVVGIAVERSYRNHLERRGSRLTAAIGGSSIVGLYLLSRVSESVPDQLRVSGLAFVIGGGVAFVALYRVPGR